MPYTVQVLPWLHHTRPSLRLGILLMLATALSTVRVGKGVAQAGPDDVQATYRDVVTRAVAEFEAGHFAEARALFLRAHELMPSARTLRTLGMTSFEMRTYPRALEELQAALTDPRRPLSEEQRRELTDLIERTRVFVGRYRLQVSPPHAELLLDGIPQATSAETLVLSVGEHVLLARASGYGELRRALHVQGREDETLVLVLEPTAAPAASPPATQPAPEAVTSPDRTPAWIAFGTGAAGLIASAVFTGLTLSDKNELATKCPANHVCPPEYRGKVDEMQRFADFATVGLVTAALGAAAGTYFWLSAEVPPSARARGARMQPWIGLGSTGLTGAF